MRHIDFAWMLSHFSGTPMWVDYNTLLYQDSSPKQILHYLTTINASPTNKAVLVETIEQSNKVANECG